MQDGTGDTEPVSFHESAQPYATQISHAVPHHHPYDPQSHLVYPHPYRQHQIPTGPPCLSRPALPVQERHSPRRQPTVDLARELPPDFPTLFGPVPVTVHTPVQFNQPLDDIEDARPTPTQSYTAIPPYPPPPLSPSYLSDRLRSLPFSRPPPHHSTTNVEVTSLSSPHPRIYASTNQHPPHRPLPSPLLHAPFHPPSRNIHPIPITEPLAPTSMNNQTHVQPPMFPYPPTYESFSMDRSIDMDAEALQHERQYEAELQRWRSSEQTWRHDRGILTAEDVDGDLMGTGPSTASRMISEQTFEDDLLPPEGIPMQAPRANHMRLQSSTEPLRSFDGEETQYQFDQQVVSSSVAPASHLSTSLPSAAGLSVLAFADPPGPAEYPALRPHQRYTSRTGSDHEPAFTDPSSLAAPAVSSHPSSMYTAYNSFGPSLPASRPLCDRTDSGPSSVGTQSPYTPACNVSGSGLSYGQLSLPSAEEPFDPDGVAFRLNEPIEDSGNIINPHQGYNYSLPSSRGSMHPNPRITRDYSPQVDLASAPVNGVYVSPSPPVPAPYYSGPSTNETHFTPSCDSSSLGYAPQSIPPSFFPGGRVEPSSTVRPSHDPPQPSLSLPQSHVPIPACASDYRPPLIHLPSFSVRPNLQSNYSIDDESTMYQSASDVDMSYSPGSRQASIINNTPTQPHPRGSFLASASHEPVSTNLLGGGSYRPYGFPTQPVEPSSSVSCSSQRGMFHSDDAHSRASSCATSFSQSSPHLGAPDRSPLFPYDSSSTLDNTYPQMDYSATTHPSVQRSFSNDHAYSQVPPARSRANYRDSAPVHAPPPLAHHSNSAPDDYLSQHPPQRSSDADHRPSFGAVGTLGSRSSAGSLPDLSPFTINPVVSENNDLEQPHRLRKQSRIDPTAASFALNPGSSFSASSVDPSSTRSRARTASASVTMASVKRVPTSPIVTTIEPLPVLPDSSKGLAKKRLLHPTQPCAVCSGCGGVIAKLFLRGERETFDVLWEGWWLCLDCVQEERKAGLRLGAEEARRQGSTEEGGDGNQADASASSNPALGSLEAFQGAEWSDMSASNPTCPAEQPPQKQKRPPRRAKRVEVPGGKASVLASRRKRNRETHDTSAPLTCDVCLKEKGRGGIVPVEREQTIEFSVEFVCVSCEQKYKRCTDCGGGGGGRIGIGKWRCKEVFRPDRKTCSLSHTRIGNAPLDLGVWEIGEIPDGTGPPNEDGKPEEDVRAELIRRCEIMWRDRMLSRLAIPEVLETIAPNAERKVHTSAKPPRERTFTDIQAAIDAGWPSREKIIEKREPGEMEVSRRYVGLTWVKTRPRKGTTAESPEAEPDDRSLFATADGTSLKKSQSIIPSGSELVGLWIGDWSIPNGTLLISTALPFEGSDGDDRATMAVGEIACRIIQETSELNAKTLAAPPPHNLIPPLLHLWCISDGSSPLVREKMQDILARRRQFLPLDDYLAKHPDVDPIIFQEWKGPRPGTSWAEGGGIPATILVRWLGEGFNREALEQLAGSDLAKKARTKRR